MSKKLLENYIKDVANFILEFDPNASKNPFGDDENEMRKKEAIMQKRAKLDRIKSKQNASVVPDHIKGERDKFQKRTVRDKESAVDSKLDTISPEEKETQDTIYKFKIRLGKLEVKEYLSNFIKSMKDFNKNVTKYKSEKDDVIKYLAPLKASMIALSGILQSMVADLDKIEKKINGE